MLGPCRSSLATSVAQNDEQGLGGCRKVKAQARCRMAVFCHTSSMEEVLCADVFVLGRLSKLVLN